MNEKQTHGHRIMGAACIRMSKLAMADSDNGRNDDKELGGSKIRLRAAQLNINE